MIGVLSLLFVRRGFQIEGSDADVIQEGPSVLGKVFQIGIMRFPIMIDAQLLNEMMCGLMRVGLGRILLEEGSDGTIPRLVA